MGKEKAKIRDDKADPFAEGADAALGGSDITDNPYPVRTDEHLSWNDGFSSIFDHGYDIED